ncbi:MAG TPA: FAD-binding oxidoreductase [Bryobacteraceae bacterium]|nr:FAD-binding oxidoreductase [Bryobacteraceae bacterium]
MKATLVDFREIGPDVRHFVFEVPGVKEFYFVPGQFVSLTQNLEGKEITRAYSISSAPNGNRFDLCLNRVQDGIFSNWLFTLAPGDTVETSAPLGYFILRNPQRDAVLVATGTGIAPFRSMLEAWLGQDDPKQLTLIFGVRYEHNLFYRDEFEELARKHPNFRFWPTLSRPEPSWQGRTGHVQQHLIEALGDRRDLDVYICGLKLMVDDVRAMLKGMGFDRKQIIYEKYD